LPHVTLLSADSPAQHHSVLVLNALSSVVNLCRSSRDPSWGG
jgi:hypothetical protein